MVQPTQQKGHIMQSLEQSAYSSMPHRSVALQIGQLCDVGTVPVIPRLLRQNIQINQSTRRHLENDGLPESQTEAVQI